MRIYFEGFERIINSMYPLGVMILFRCIYKLISQKYYLKLQLFGISLGLNHWNHTLNSQSTAHFAIRLKEIPQPHEMRSTWQM